MKSSVPASLLDQLAHIDTPTVCNAIEQLQYRLRNEGYIDSRIILRTPHSQPLVGYAVTLQMRTSNPPMRGQSYKERDDWWDSILSIPSPRVLIIQDMDTPSGTGSVVGSVQAEIFKALGCTGIVTNGAVRDLDALTKSSLQIFSSSVCPSQAYAHIIDVEKTITLFDQTFKPGDIVHADKNGITSLPKNSVEEVILKAKTILEFEKNLIRFCNSRDFALPALKKLLTNME